MSELKPANDGSFGGTIVPFVTIADRAAKIKGEIAMHLQAICVQMDDAERMGLIVEFSVSKDAFKKNAISRLLVAIPY
ncbi:MAG: hypothetical protein ACLPPF_17570 [Rhodomicrobium sp.]